jgi:hypothetical protein
VAPSACESIRRSDASRFSVSGSPFAADYNR